MVVFRCLEQIHAEDDQIDGNMLKILNLLDGYRSLASIAFATGMSMSEFQKAVKALIARGLIAPVEADKVLAD